MAPKQDASFSFNTVAVLVAVMSSKGVTIGRKDYQQMALLDGVKTESSFDHQFRDVKKKDDELLAQAGDDNGDQLGTPKPKTSKSLPKSGGSSKRKQPSKSSKDQLIANDTDDEELKTPTKKVKLEKIKREPIKEEPEEEREESPFEAASGIFK